MSSTTNNPCTEPTNALIFNLLTQKRQAALYYIPPTRLKLISPYPTYTKIQLDMRRKVEILKYKNQNSQANGLTKSQRWSQLVSGSVSVSQSTASENTIVNCESDLLKPTLTSACDVPGPPIYLTYDPNVPLYNYTNLNRTYAIQNENDTSLWKLYTTNEILTVQSNTSAAFSINVANSNETSLGVIIITDLITNPTTSYTISTPIAIWCKGFLSGSEYNTTTKTYTVPRPIVAPIKVSITGVELKIYYNTIPQIFQTIQKNSSLNLTSFIIDPNKTIPQIFYAIQYVGILSIPTFVLNTQPGNIYNISLNFIYDFIDTTTNQPYDWINNPINGFAAGVFCNLSPANINVYANPTRQLLPGVNNAVISLPSPTPYSSGSFENFNNILAQKIVI